LELLEKGEYLTIKPTNKYSVISILNWHKYQFDDQQNDQQVTNKRPTNDQQVTTNNNVLNDFNDLNDFNTTTGKPAFIQILDLYCELHNKIDPHVNGKERSAMQELADSGIPIDFILETMKQLF